jgi:RNA ligase (TIGR02306 family)
MRTVREILPIEGADRIELAKVDGWQMVVGKGDFKVGDRGVMFEIDSLIPGDDERFKFLSRGQVRTHYRIKSMKLRGTLSQGLLMPTSILTDDEAEQLMLSPEQDMAALLGVQKYEPTMPMGGKQKGTFPTHLVPKTDQERIQNVPEVLEGRNNREFEITEKLDGTSCTFFACIEEGPVLGDSIRTGVCSRNWEMQILDSNVYGDKLLFRAKSLVQVSRRRDTSVALRSSMSSICMTLTPDRI